MDLVIRILAILFSCLFFVLSQKINYKESIKRFLFFMLVGFIGSKLVSFIECNSTFKGARNSGAYLLTLIVFFLDKKKNYKMYLDAFLASLIGTLIIGKWSCFLIGDTCYGIHTNSILGMEFHGIVPSFGKVFPVMIFDSFFGLLLFIYILFNTRKKQYKKLFLNGLLILSLYCFCIEFIRINKKVFLDIFSINQVVYFILIFLVCTIKLNWVKDK